VLEKIGVGGVSSVYKVQRKVDGEISAVKKIKVRIE